MFKHWSTISDNKSVIPSNALCPKNNTGFFFSFLQVTLNKHVYYAALTLLQGKHPYPRTSKHSDQWPKKETFLLYCSSITIMHRGAQSKRINTGQCYSFVHEKHTHSWSYFAFNIDIDILFVYLLFTYIYLQQYTYLIVYPNIKLHNLFCACVTNMVFFVNFNLCNESIVALKHYASSMPIINGYIDANWYDCAR